MVSLRTLVPVVCAAVASVQAHGILTNPKPDFSKIIQGFSPNAPCGLIDGQKAMADPTGMAYGNGDANYKAFTQAFQSSSFTSLKDLVVKTTDYYSMDKQCGFSDPTKTSATLADVIEFADRPGEPGFYPDHQGPCELWCDDVRVMQNDNCAKAYTTSPAKIPVDKTKCNGKKVLQFVWLAVHMPKWQAYINCVGLAGSATPTMPSPAPAPAPAPSTPSMTPSTPPTMSPSPMPSPSSSPMPTTTAPYQPPMPTTTMPYPYPAPMPSPSTAYPSPTASRAYPSMTPTTAPAPVPSSTPCNGKANNRKHRRHHHQHNDDMQQFSIESGSESESDGSDMGSSFQ